MSDNRTTERLMAMLEERGVKHELEHDLYVEWVDARGNDVTAFETSCKHKGDVLIVHVFLTPEQAIAATLGSDTKSCYAADENYKRCKYSVNRGWCDDAPFLVWNDTGHLFITMGGLKTWDVTDDAKKWFAELGSGTCEYVIEDNMNETEGMGDVWFRCTNCDMCFDYADDWLLKMPYCPHCGARVKAAKQ